MNASDRVLYSMVDALQIPLTEKVHVMSGSEEFPFLSPACRIRVKAETDFISADQAGIILYFGGDLWGYMGGEAQGSGTRITLAFFPYHGDGFNLRRGSFKATLEQVKPVGKFRYQDNEWQEIP